MVMKYSGTLTELKALMKQHGITGVWQKQPNDVHMMRRRDGANLHWAAGSKTMWFDGERSATRTLQRDVAWLLYYLGDGGSKPSVADRGRSSRRTSALDLLRVGLMPPSR